MVKFPEAEARMFKRKFVCRRCKSVIKSDNMTILGGKISCRRCKGHAFKAKRKK